MEAINKPNQRTSSINIETYQNQKQCLHILQHFHQEYELVYIQGGQGKLRIANREYLYQKEVIALIAPHIPHYNFGNPNYPNELEIVIHFDSTFVQQRLLAFPEFLSIQKFLKESSSVLVYDFPIPKKLSKLFQQIPKSTPSQKLIYTLQILDLLQAQKSTCLFPKPFEFIAFQSDKTQHILAYINQYFAQKISTQHIAQEMNMSINSFCRVFKSISQKPFMEYLNEFRINNAAYLLESDHLSISESMFQSGFNNSSYFTKQFKKHKGVTPSNYQKIHRNL